MHGTFQITEKKRGSFPNRIAFLKNIKNAIGYPIRDGIANSAYRGLSGKPEKRERVDIRSHYCWATDEWIEERRKERKEKEKQRKWWAPRLTTCEKCGAKGIFQRHFSGKYLCDKCR